MEADKEIRADAKLKNLSREVRDDLWRMRHPEEDGEKVRSADILVWLQSTHGVRCSLAALSEYYAWERSERRMEAARLRAEQARRLMAQDPAATPEAIARMGQMAFTSEMVDAGNVRAFVALEKLRLAQRLADQDERRLAMLEAKAKRIDEAEAKIREIQGDAKLTPEQQRAMVLEKMDEFFGLKKRN